ncbi:LacI family DNA-binding transcriptional regulator [Cryptosporangium minutisporangium]|uniref:LacI family DNA-binding transcriptional regulator n=1 Tax=Cryptosporangium minutisporangium TaxID=113569 RepID=A0ABP6STG3_9ACTN
MPQQRKRATIRHVAEATGLSTAAVSYALRGLQTSEETQRRVREAAAELGYEADPIARALASGRTGTVGLLCGSLEDLWQQSLAVAMGRELLGQDRYALILDAAGDPAREAILARQLRDQRVDALVVQPLDPSAPHWAELAGALPIVSIGDPLNGVQGGEVLFDNRTGVTLALEHLTGLGHRRIAVLTPNRPSTPDRPAEVHVGIEAARLGIDVRLVTSPHALAGATAVATEVLAADDKPTAVFCFADSIAYGVHAAARRLGLDIPADVSVVGYDSHPMSGLLSPALTTVDWDLAGIVRQATALAVAQIEKRAHRRRFVRAPRLWVRDSTAPPAV